MSKTHIFIGKSKRNHYQLWRGPFETRETATRRLDDSGTWPHGTYHVIEVSQDALDANGMDIPKSAVES